MKQPNLQLATFGGGCFWCVEAVFQRVAGVTRVVSGYSGGKERNPSYREVCGGRTGHAEVVQITFDPDVVSYETLVEIFLTTHDPTTLNRQGADRGTQYRSIILYHDAAQKATAEAVIARLADHFDDPIVTEVTYFDVFYPAEDVHQNYYNENTWQPYCTVVISPKLRKLRQQHADKLNVAA